MDFNQTNDTRELVINRLQEEMDPGTFLSGILPFLLENKDRIVFVRESPGHVPKVERNFLSIYESEEYYDLYIREGLEDVVLTHLNEVENVHQLTLEGIVRELENMITALFEHTDDYLFVTVIFDRSSLSESEAWDLYDEMLQSGYSSGGNIDLVLDKIKYPEWYIGITEDVADELHYVERLLHEIKKEELKEFSSFLDRSLKKSLFENDFETTQKLLKLYEEAGLGSEFSDGVKR